MNACSPYSGRTPLPSTAGAAWSRPWPVIGMPPQFAADELLSKFDEHQVEVVIDYDSLEAMSWRNPDRYNVEDFVLLYWERYPDRFCAICLGRLPYNPFENHACD